MQFTVMVAEMVTATTASTVVVEMMRTAHIALLDGEMEVTTVDTTQSRLSTLTVTDLQN